jgi:hypothetical protein
MSDTKRLFTRRELFMQKIADSSVQAPEPSTREEMYLAKMAGMDVAIPTPSSRAEMYLAAAAGEDVVLPDPVSRDELFLAKMAGMDVITPEPSSSMEILISNAAGGGEPSPSYSVREYIERTIAGTYKNKRVKSIGDYAFYGCANLTSVKFTAANSIGEGAFGNCSSLDAMILPAAEVVSLDAADVFDSTPIAAGTGFIYVPAALIDSYKTGNWATYANQMRAIEDYPDICA